jgi:hypothetical protein
MKIFLDGLQSTTWCLFSGYLVTCTAMLITGIIIGRGIGNSVKKINNKKFDNYENYRKSRSL